MKTLSSILIILILVVVGLVGYTVLSLAPTAVSVPISHAGTLRQVIQTGHSSLVTSVAFSPNGHLVLSGSEDGAIKLWEVDTGREIRTFTTYSSEVNSVAFSPDGQFALSGSDDGTVKLWKIDTGKKIRTLTGNLSIVNSVAFSPDGQFALSGGDNSAMELWNLAAGKVMRTFGTIQHCTNIETKNEIIYNCQHVDMYVIDSVAFSPNGQFTLSGSNNCTMKLWEVSTAKELRTITKDSGGVVAYSPDGQFALSGCGHELELWDISTGKRLRNFYSNYSHSRTSAIRSIAFSPDGRFVISGYGDSTVTEVGVNQITLWEVATGKELYSFSPSIPVRSVAFSPDGHSVLSGGGEYFGRQASYSLKLWNIVTGIEWQTFTILTNSVNSVSFSHDGKLALIGSGYALNLWNVDTGIQLRSFPTTDNKPVQWVAFSPDGNLAYNGYDNLHTFSPDGDIFASVQGRPATTLNLFKMDTNTVIRTFTEKDVFSSIAFSPDGRTILGILDGGKKLKLWNVTTGTEQHTFTGYSSYITSSAFSPNGSHVIFGSTDHTLKLWDVVSEKEIRNFIGHYSDVRSVAFSPNGSLVLSGSSDATARIWDVASGQWIIRMISTTDGEWSVSTPDGYYNTSPEGKSAVHYASDTETYSFEQFESLFRRPDIIQARLAGNLKAGTPAPKLTRPPRVTLVSTRNLTPTTDKAIYPLAITATSHDDLVQTVRVFVNGKPALEKPVNAKEQRLDFEVPLFAGPNRITTVAYDRKGFSSNQASIDIISTVPGAKKPTLFVMAVGISQYPKMRKGDQLDYAHTDAQNLVKTLRQQKGQLFADVRDFTLTNKEATPRAITDGLHALSAMDANDIAIIFFAGHGVQSKDGRFWYVTQQGSLKQPESGGLDWQILGERISHIKGRVILFLDACHSGSITDETIVPNDQLAAKFFKGGMGGVMVFSASKGRQTSLENETIGGGLFTHYLTQGLTVKETDRDNNGFVEFMELVDYVSKAVNEKTSGQQTPWLSRRELFGDLAVATVQ